MFAIQSKTMFAWFSHLVEECYFDRIDMFFLIAGHTHCPIDQLFSVVGAAITKAEFIGSKFAMASLMKLAHSMTDQSSRDSIIKEVIEMEVYHDYDSKYGPIINPLLHYHGGPHRYCIKRHPVSF
jgi:hypothetical protein